MGNIRSEWDDKSIAFLKNLIKNHKSNVEISESLKNNGLIFSPDAIGKKISRLGISRTIAPKEPTVDETLAQFREKKTVETFRRSEKQLIERVDVLEAERAVWFAMRDFKSTHVVQQLEQRRISATAFLLLGDTHAEEEVKPESVSHLNEYNLEVADKRFTNYFNNGTRLLEIYSHDTYLDGVVLCILGDMITGNIHEENLENCLLQPMDAILWVMNRLIPGIKMIESWCKRKKIPLTAVCKVGNHSRITKKRHISTEEGNALEWMLYHTLKMTFPGINWIIDRSYLTYLKVYDGFVRVHHGTAIKYGGGVGGPLISIAKATANWDKAIKAFLNVQGHLHTSMNALGTICNGSMIGYSPFAVEIKAGYEDPSQSGFLITNKRETVMACPIFVKERMD